MLTVMNPAAVHETSRSGASHAPNVAAVTTTGVAIGLRERPLVLAEDRSQALARARTEREEKLSNVVRKYFPTSPVTVHVEDSDRIARTILEAADGWQSWSSRWAPGIAARFRPRSSVQSMKK